MNSTSKPPTPSDRLVWITGAGSGIGRALGETYGTTGHTVILSGRNERPLLDLQTAIHAKGGRAFSIVCDVREESSVKAAARTIVESHGAPDILVNNAGVTVFKQFLETTVDDFDNIIQTNLRGSFLTTKAVLPSMIERRNGIVLNVVSFAAKTTYTESSVYAASKAGMAAMMESLRAEVRNHGIKIVNVFPGAVLTPIWSTKVQSTHGAAMMKAEEVARMIVELTCQPVSMMVEEVILRPQTGDINA